jgi:isopentenyl-diphosphate Delta-isomerase
MNAEHVILVDEADNETGTMEKMQAHREGRLHRAISVLVFNSKNEMLLQRRAFTKYHSAGLWSNTCCSHPFLSEEPLKAATRRLAEEMGMNVPLKFQFKFQYRAALDHGLIENEMDHVFIGTSDDLPLINTDEVSEFKYVSLEELRSDIKNNPDQYSQWLPLILDGL